jgi:hypothetical protein
MWRRWWARIAVGAIVAMCLVYLLVMGGRAPQLSGVGQTNGGCGEGSCLSFPAISGQSLAGDTLNLPEDFMGNTNLVLAPFDEAQQVTAQSWLPLARELGSRAAGFRAYNVPVFPAMAAPMRVIIRTGMNLSIPDADLRDATITVFLDDRDAFLAALNIPNTEAMPVFLLDGKGRVLWRGAGEYTAAQADAVRGLVAR